VTHAMRTLQVVAALAAVSCARSPSAPPAGDPCSAAALGLGKATRAAPWQPPPGCSLAGRGGPPVLVRSEAELRAAVTCAGDVTSGIDFAAHALVLQSITLSPASTGADVFDDGAVVTVVTRQRRPCPGDPQPMPIGHTVAALVSGAGERTVRESTCVADTTCR